MIMSKFHHNQDQMDPNQLERKIASRKAPEAEAEGMTGTGGRWPDSESPGTRGGTMQIAPSPVHGPSQPRSPEEDTHRRERKPILLMALGCLIPLGVLLAYFLGFRSPILFFAVFLLCPLSMGLMMWMMMRNEGRHSH
jgi:hypothetical protein